MSGQDLTQQVFDDQQIQKPNPMDVFSQWLLEARLEEINDANAMSLATVDADGMPDCRIMLLNGQDEKGFFFYTNTRSAKGAELLANPRAALLFHWKSLRRQVRIRGEVVDLSPEQSDAYFATRPRGSQIGAHASFQSQPIMDSDELQARVKELEKEFEGRDVPRPAHWRGFRVEPVQIEFWQNGEFRLHDRVVFRRTSTEQPWVAQRLNP
ncbi:MAG TPA: pyridoxamine 5'-phosphate oxidase [Devosia sp.]|nr:pyridoxamine 5'-phosphate oxidase [Devosia sp.]